MLNSIRTRLTLSHLVVIVVAMGLSGFLLLSLLQQYFLQAIEDSLTAQAQITAQALIPGASTEGPPIEAQNAAYNALQQQQFSNLALRAENVAPPPGELPVGEIDLTYLNRASLQLSSQLDTRIRILDATGAVVVDSHPDGNPAELIDDPVIAQALTGQYASRTDQKGSDGQPAMVVALPILVEGKLVGVTYLSQSLNDLTVIMGDLRSRWLAATLVALLLSAVAGLLLSRAVARPVQRLTTAASAVAEGHLDQQVPVGSRDELGRLSQTFNVMTARLRAMRQMQIDFVANVSHELRTPLTAIKGLVETLRDGAVDDVEVRDQFLETVEDETDRLIRLVNDLMILSRADSEALNLNIQPLGLPRLLKSITDRLGPQAGARHVGLRLEIGPGIPPAQADSDRLEQVLVNLLDNAIKYSQPGGTVTVSVEGPREGALLVRVHDQGIGIPAEELDRIGERFYRADRARSRAAGGSGLGLAIARALVEAHGGALWIESEEGHGTTVSFSLPAATP